MCFSKLFVKIIQVPKLNFDEASTLTFHVGRTELKAFLAVHFYSIQFFIKMPGGSSVVI